MKKFLFRNVRMILAVALSMVMIFSCSLPSFATSVDYDAEFDAIMEAMSQKHILTTEEMSNMKFEGTISVLDTSAFYDTLNSLDMNAFGQLDYEIPSSVHSQNLLSAQYAVMQQGLADLGFGTAFELNVPEMDLGYSKNIQAEFKDIYGDLSYKFNDDVSLPDGWDMASLMETTLAKRDKYAVDIKNSEAYKVVSDSISANKTVTMAITTLETPELKDAVTLQEMLDESAAGIKGDWDSKSESGHAAIDEIYRVNTEDKYNEDFQALYDEAVGDMTAWLELNGVDPSEESDALFDAIFGQASESPFE